ncbi:uncharacterized protein TRIADDRAFT_53544 [Trichoplax adhaerens]|uniref:sn-1-specific diacylglycerol lipase n=1 Tax=Trichoplax adhaerens TaxID=10228 RepID=B3RPH3_TRIAD|nr:hypothetical protein TRIADDRAFT_53544 [Trichoplax adhaerens]EDV28188.1 hypothetical protein TRIADDRAFT_53544 [Trichoplax adhaerens]|eukprot:XP_002110022.1 hypothetical protein TRIADDRAFT_53544 [Trichoplax adhaerens]
MPLLLYLRLFFTIPEIALNILGTYWSFDDSRHCPDEDIIIVKVAVITNWCLLAFGIIFTYCVFDPLGSVKRDGNLDPSISYKLAQQVWETRCRHLCCCSRVNDSNQAIYTDLATIFATFFRNTNTVPTDVAAGLFLLQQRQRYDEKYILPWRGTQVIRKQFTPARRMDLSNKDEENILQDISYYIHYADAAYGWPLCVLQHFLTAPCKLVPKYRCCSCARPLRNSGTIIINDNCCECNYAALKLQSGFDDEDIIVASYCNDLYELPFFVAYDHCKKKVILAIRGTMSLNDAITDLLAVPAELDIPGYHDTSGHKGMCESAKVLKEKLKSQKLLEPAFNEHPDYDLIIVGHSLGAGVAAILSILMKPDYPKLRCFAYSPPGGLVSLELSKYARDFVISVVTGCDLVTRVSLQNMEDLRNKLLLTIRSSRIPKYKVFLAGCCCCSNYMSQDREDREVNVEVADTNEDIDDPGKEEKKSILPLITQDEDDEDFFNEFNVKTLVSAKLYLPGRIVHLVKETTNNQYNTDQYHAYWNYPENFNVIKVESTMISDHMLAASMAMLNKIKQQISVKEELPS